MMDAEHRGPEGERPVTLQRECWCGGSAARRIGRFADGHVLVQCERCAVQALWPQPTDEQLVAAYSSEYYGTSRRKFVWPVAQVIGLFQGGRARLVQRQVNRGGSVLDVGCGNGGFLMQLKTRGYRVAGTEWTAAAAARVPPEAGIDVHVGDVTSLNAPPGSFDAVTLWHVFEHLRTPRESLAAIHRLLKPSGALLMSMPNAESPQARRYGVHWLHHDPPRHLFGFGPHSLSLLLDEAGFHVAADGFSTWSFEQNPFGEVQSSLNQRGYPRDRLYGQLKGIHCGPLRTRLADLARGAALAPLALLRDVMESARLEGATMTVIARRKS